MSRFEEIQQEALGSHGVFTYKTAHAMGVLSPELSRWMKLGRIIKLGHGVYRLTTFPMQGAVSDMAALLAEVGEDSYLYGETVLGFLELCPTRSYKAFVATPHRCRRSLSDGIVVIRGDKDYKPTYYMGIPSQRIQDAVLSSVGAVDPSRIVAAIDAAVEKGYFIESEALALKDRVLHGNATEKRARTRAGA